MKEMWRSDSCYGNYGVDGSTCSFFIYLSEVSPVCVHICVIIVQVYFKFIRVSNLQM